MLVLCHMTTLLEPLWTQTNIDSHWCLKILAHPCARSVSSTSKWLPCRYRERLDLPRLQTLSSTTWVVFLQEASVDPNGFSFDGTDDAALDYALDRALHYWYFIALIGFAPISFLNCFTLKETRSVRDAISWRPQYSYPCAPDLCWCCLIHCTWLVLHFHRDVMWLGLRSFPINGYALYWIYHVSRGRIHMELVYFGFEYCLSMLQHSTHD